MAGGKNDVDPPDFGNRALPNGLAATNKGLDQFGADWGDLGRRTARGGVLAVAARLFSMVLQVIATVLLARLLSPSDFGLAAMAGTVTGFFSLFTELGLSQATVQRKTISQDISSAFFYANFLIGILVALLMITFAPVAARFYDDARLTPLIAAFALALPIVAAGKQHAALLQRDMQWKTLFRISIIAQGIASAVTVVAALATDLGYWVLVLQVWISTLLTTGIAIAVKPWRPRRVNNWRAIREPLSFGLHLSAFNFLNYFHRQFDDVLVGWRWGIVPLGHYNRAYVLLTMPLQLINGPAEMTVLPMLSRLQDQPRRWAEFYCRSLYVTVFFTAPLAAALIVMAPDLVRILYGARWDMAGEIFQVLAISIFFQPIISSTGWLWISTGKSRRMLKWAMIAIPIIVVGMLVGLPYGPKGVALGYSITISALTPICTWFASRQLPISVAQVYRSIAVPMLSAIIALAVSEILFVGREGVASAILQLGCVGVIYVAATLAYDRHFLQTIKLIARDVIVRKDTI